MAAHLEFPKRNAAYAATFDKGDLALPPAKKYIVITCMDARVEPASQLGIELGDAHVIRNAGGVAQDAIRSIVISQRLLGTREIAVFHHTGCGMLLFTTEHLREVVKDADPGNAVVAEAVDKIDFLEFGHLQESVKSDVKFLQEHPLVLKDTKVTGWIYDVTTGKVSQVV
ncbi:putative reversible hydration of carbon dioxide [Lyophyllum shimeji]|uniref:Carbonic anhydrase n=1 Tax=Lyophyllum shimeji TaxID=47721 RepID=A0A9P3UKB1_LYOSH|nr:putative reversible hydration of carbon dioxide [Lyophyllum shimeji]